jgi:hypothetical protein
MPEQIWPWTGGEDVTAHFTETADGARMATVTWTEAGRPHSIYFRPGSDAITSGALDSLANP